MSAVSVRKFLHALSRCVQNVVNGNAP